MLRPLDFHPQGVHTTKAAEEVVIDHPIAAAFKYDKAKGTVIGRVDIRTVRIRTRTGTNVINRAERRQLDPSQRPLWPSNASTSTQGRIIMDHKQLTFEEFPGYISS